ncbi:hypothetical protein P4V56_29530 [Brevibacillus porteri]|nr:hypothetical protein [Brevibacillus porteri]
MRESAWQRCSKCGHGFQVLADEAGDHDCPWCGFGPEREEEEEDKQWEDDDDE